MRALVHVALTGALLCGVAAPRTFAQDAKSAEPARTLAKLLEARELGAVAAKDPDTPGRFVAALHFAGSQLFVLSAEYPVPVLLEQRLRNREYMEAYLDLQGSSPRKGRFFVEDLQANGLRPGCGPNEPFDIVYVDGTTETLFNGDWMGQRLTEAEYRARFTSADLRYARLLAALISVLRPET